ncbi:MAG: right-handed parallel beta-helix repeat-containing protein [Candidatus Bipolaricaulota bacterium]|nr:right-handed parallel beta-helix repeat-containing protein [Candidatus Bipolaricaulota bacterium]MDW8111226.1 NosD domain-containing protein [Candidatus Bipolaricaulota bacterium]MDW8329443.1 NosD domain-containing protein [Candidatus Bipolaricaulota bacterium]
MKLNKISLLNLLGVAIGIGLWVSFAGLKDPETLGSSTVWVDGADPTCGGTSPCFRTIQAAVEAVDDSDPQGGFVFIRPGRYRENVVIKRTVSLIGVEGIVRIEPADPTRPTILISNGLQSRPIKTIHNLEIAGGTIAIEIVDAWVHSLFGNRITSLTNLGSSFAPPSVASRMIDLMNAGIWVERAVIGGTGGGILSNEISYARAGIVIGQEASVSDISKNTIQRTGWGIYLQNQMYITRIANNVFKHDGIHIRVTGKATSPGRIEIVSNQMLLAELHGIEVNAEGMNLTIENNLITNSGMAGILLSCQSPSFVTPVWVGEEDPCPRQQGPDFIIIRNHIVGGQYGIILVTGKGKILRNRISENGSTTSILKGAGLLLGQKMQVDISHNWIVNNTLGAGYSVLAAYQPDCQFLERPPFEGKLTGVNNEIHENEFADLCPPDYPWPPGFRK